MSSAQVGEKVRVRFEVRTGERTVVRTLRQDAQGLYVTLYGRRHKVNPEGAGRYRAYAVFRI